MKSYLLVAVILLLGGCAAPKTDSTDSRRHFQIIDPFGGKVIAQISLANATLCSEFQTSLLEKEKEKGKRMPEGLVDCSSIDAASSLPYRLSMRFVEVDVPMYFDFATLKFCELVLQAKTPDKSVIDESSCHLK